MKRYVMGDIHGAYLALMQCLGRSGVNYEHDKLIVLGDVCDGWAHVKACIEELLKIKNLIYILGNHDKWAYEWATTGAMPEIWVTQGGYNTIKSYDVRKGMPSHHIKFLRSAPWHYEEDNKLFVHGGLTDPMAPIKKQLLNDLIWDRELLYMAVDQERTSKTKKLSQWDEIYLGHTTTLSWKLNSKRITTPIHACEVWDLDTGAGWGGKLTIMDIDTKDYWQSDLSTDLYPGQRGR